MVWTCESDEQQRWNPSIVKKAMFSYYPLEKRPRNAGKRKNWEDKILDDVTKYGIRNWRRESMNRNQGRISITKKAYTRPPTTTDILNTVQLFKHRANLRRSKIQGGH